MSSCLREDVYVRRISACGQPYFLEGLGSWLEHASFDVVVCADCGLTRLFAEPSARENVRTASGWTRRIPPANPEPVIFNRQSLVAALNSNIEKNKLQVFEHAKTHLLAALEEFGFTDFQRGLMAVLSRIRDELAGRDSEHALWGHVFLDLWFGENFGGDHWQMLIERDPSNIPYAIQAAFWTWGQSGKDGGLFGHQRSPEQGVHS